MILADASQLILSLKLVTHMVGVLLWREAWFDNMGLPVRILILLQIASDNLNNLEVPSQQHTVMVEN